MVSDVLLHDNRLEETLISTKAIAIFSWQLGGAIAVAIGQNLLLNNLKTSIPAHTSEVSVQQVLDAGAGGLRSTAPDIATLQDLREAYADALGGTFVLASVVTCLALPFAAGMQWLNIKRIAEERRKKAMEEKTEGEGEKGGAEIGLTGSRET
jgi:hypothetical protein